MYSIERSGSDPFGLPVDGEGREDWEEWEDEEALTATDADDQVSTPIDANDVPLIAFAPSDASTQPRKPTPSRKSLVRYSVHRPARLKSRKRQKAQNARAGIRLVTDLSAFRRQEHQVRRPAQQPKFVDAAALKALEGSPSSATVGNWNWLRRQKSSQSPASAKSPGQQDLSPNDRPIVIGIALHPDALNGREISPQTAVLETPLDLPDYLSKTGPPTVSTTSTTPLTPSQQRSVWSPDTPDTSAPFGSPRPASSVYSQATGISIAADTDVPPVPAVPSSYKIVEKVVNIELKDDDNYDDGGSPCTLFEEDAGPSPRKSLNANGLHKPHPNVSGAYGENATDWWEGPKKSAPGKGDSFKARKERLRDDSGRASGEWWREVDKKKTVTAERVIASNPAPRSPQPPVIRVPSPRRTPPPTRSLASATMSSSPRPTLQHTRDSASNMSNFTVETEIPLEEPPPYSPPHKQTAVRYRALFPPGHPLQARYPPSPGPASPGLAGTMTSQGGISLTEIPLTPQSQPLFIGRPIGSFVPEDHSVPANGQAHRVERERRRHEKEEVVARKAAGFWRGRGCIPSSGCYGRTGREGRKRRRVCFGIVGGAIGIIILVVVLAVTLTRKPPPPAAVDSIFVNLTDFPPMPTGILTVVGPDLTADFDGCTEPATLWSCALPKELHETVSPYNADQPTVALQIQWDNSTSQGWNVPNGTPPRPDTKSDSRKRSSRHNPNASAEPQEDHGGAGAYVRARRALRIRQSSAPAFSPQPPPPSFEDMWFLGDTTDGIVSSDKAGEPAPFYISILESVQKPVEESRLTRRQSEDKNKTIGIGGLGITLPSPELTESGTGAPARLLPLAVQQPVRLYDRGLPTEHYGFYTYYRRTLYVKSTTVLKNSSVQNDVPLDENGGSRETEADFLVTWAQTRFLVKIWTKRQDTARLLSKGSKTGIQDTAQLTRPGTMPYPVTMKIDSHGGDPTQKFVWAWEVDDRQRIQTDRNSTTFLLNDLEKGGTVVNPRKDRNPSFGGVDGGSGGCRCEWINFLEKRPQSSD